MVASTARRLRSPVHTTRARLASALAALKQQASAAERMSPGNTAADIALGRSELAAAHKQMTELAPECRAIVLAVYASDTTVVAITLAGVIGAGVVTFNDTTTGAAS